MGKERDQRAIMKQRMRKRKDKWRGQEVEGSMQSSDVLTGWVWGGGGGGREPGIILVSHCLLFSNQLLSSAAPWKRVNEGSRALECQGTVRGAEIKSRGWREQGDMGWEMWWWCKGIECKIREREEKKSSVREASGSVMHLVCPALSFLSSSSFFTCPALQKKPHSVILSSSFPLCVSPERTKN